MSKHLPTPWEARCRGSKIDFVSVEPNGIFTEVGQVYLNDYSGKTVSPSRRGNAKLVFVACNTHDELHGTLTSIEEAAAAGRITLSPEIMAAVRRALDRVLEEESLAEKAIKPAGAPCRQFWDATQVYKNAPSR